MNSAPSVSSNSASWAIGFGTASVILLLIGYYTFFWIPYLGWAAGLLALIFGIITLRRPVKVEGNQKTMATAGIAIGLISMLYLIFSVAASFIVLIS
jgi:hypothetical protein